MVTPSLVIVGAPHFLSMTTLRPFGPSVTLTVSASRSTPRCNESRASEWNCRIFDIRFLSRGRPGSPPDRRAAPGGQRKGGVLFDDPQDNAGRPDEGLLRPPPVLRAPALREDER